MRNARWLVVLTLAALGLPSATAQELPPDGQRVVDYLLQEWDRQFSSTTIPHAMEWLGLEVDDELRIAIVEHLRVNDSLAQNLQWWGANNYLFSNDEKRIAKYLILLHERDGRVPTLVDAAADLEIDIPLLRRHLALMARGGFLTATNSNDLGFELADGYKRWAGPLQHNYHTVYIDGEAPLDVW